MPHKLLLADDSVTIQRVIELTFADEDVAVTAVGDGKQAIARIQADPPDIVLADVGMPEKDGYEVADFVKSDPRLAHIPVLLLTGAFEPVDEARALRVGCDGVLAKPFEPQMVITRVRELLSANQASAARPTPRMVQPPPSLRPAARPHETEPMPVAPAAPVAPPLPREPLLPPPLPPFSAGPTPIVPLPVVPLPPAAPAEPDLVIQSLGVRREVEVRMPGIEPPTESASTEGTVESDVALPVVEPPEVTEPVAIDGLEALEPAEVEPAFDEPAVSEPAAAEPPAGVLDQVIDVSQAIAEPLGSAGLPPSPGPVPSDRSPEEAAVESAIDAAIRIRRRPPVAVPEVGVPPRTLALEQEPAPAPAAKLDDYFDRLDAAFANRQAREKRPPMGPLPSVPEAIEPPPPAVDMPPVAVEPRAAVADVPSAPSASPPMAMVAPAEPGPPEPPSTGLAQAFSALLDAERGEPGAGPVPSLFAPPSISPALRDELVEQVTRRVLERLSDRVVRETVTDLVSRVTERLVREEIDRLKATIK